MYCLYVPMAEEDQGSKRPRLKMKPVQGESAARRREREQVERMLDEYLREIETRQAESVYAEGSLPQNVLNDIWSRALLVTGTTPEEAQAMARGYRPGDPIPLHEAQDELQSELNSLIDQWGEVRQPLGASRAALEALIERRDYLERQLRLYQAVRRREEYARAAKAQAAGLPELARVLATNAVLWRLWYIQEYPCQVRELPRDRHPWVVKQVVTPGVSPSVASVEAQYSHNAWRRMYVWTGFFERRCYHMLMDMARTRAANFEMIIPYLPPGVIVYRPLRPVEWTLQGAAERVPGKYYVADVRYDDEELGVVHPDVDDRVRLDTCATLDLMFEEEGRPTVSAPVLLWWMMRHWHRHADDITFMNIFIDHANLTWNDPKTGEHYMFNFLDDVTGEGVDPVTDNRRWRYAQVLASYVLWYMDALVPNDDIAAMAAAIAAEADNAGMPLRPQLLSPREQGRAIGLFDGDEWHMLKALPPVPMRGFAYVDDPVHGGAGVKFLGAPMHSLE